MAAIAINVAANTNEPGFRGPVFPDGRFEYIPIPESEPTTGQVPTYDDLAPHLDTSIPEEVVDRPVHLDPEFADYLDSARESRPFREGRVFRHLLSEPRTEQGGSESRQLR